jgi:pyrroloquinoline quinone biosynthesis protein B
VRTGKIRASPRTQSSVAVCSDAGGWFLLNASPDIRAQIHSLPGLLPKSEKTRGTGVEGILLSNADLDHSLGLLSLREGAKLSVHATPSVRRSLTEGFSVGPVLERYSGVDFREPPAALGALQTAQGRPSGLRYRAIPVPGKLPRYREGRVEPSAGDNVAYLLVDERTGGRLLYMPAVGRLGDEVLKTMAECDVLLLDGTFWDEEELIRLEISPIPASAMGHVPIGGPGGSLLPVSRLPVRRKIYVHINNTNPILTEDSPECREVLRAGMEIGRDGLEIDL